MSAAARLHGPSPDCFRAPRTFIDTRRELLSHLSKGGTVRLTRQSLKTVGELWECPQTGQVFTAAACAFALEHELMSPARDGLFGDSQSFHSNLEAAERALSELLKREAAAAT